ncbi:glycerol-3-phosphate dehydrogenase [Caulobacter sp. NIBR2454]|uniref:glycerol-3-phosphate dehydrogenase n=1 Tax=Caulobacter sp. NIBR2454 TaxID=3015996 RepID=UPI0022B6A40E|nr:glycerol-3-phosphate dehydrogenase [Caulobacter sp. NIBR2454]
MSQVDLLVIGGGVNGAGIARDAAGRGLSVVLCERRDLAGATSSASSKLVHGGLRYLEQYEFRLVHESLAEREVLLAAAPHVIWPLRFVLPVHQGLRPPWMLRIGLFLYDHIGGRRSLPGTRTISRRSSHRLDPLLDRYRLAFEYSDCWADDARLTALCARDAADRGAEILVGWEATSARRQGASWLVDLRSDDGAARQVSARAVVNAAGPWVGETLKLSGAKAHHAPRLVKGSHIVVPRLHDGDQAFTFQNSDGRIAFVIPYEQDFTLIGTTDIPYDGDPAKVAASGDETAYLCELVSEYLKTPVTPADVVWTYSGVRPLYDDGGVSASTVTRDYVFDIDAPEGQAPMLSIFGGKLTTHRKLAEHAMEKLQPLMGFEAGPWTAKAILPGGDIADFDAFAAEQVRKHSDLPEPVVRRLCRAYGTMIDAMLADGPGVQIARGVFEAELRHMRDNEWARCGEDALWRRSKLGLHLTQAERDAVTAWFGR